MSQMGHRDKSGHFERSHAIPSGTNAGLPAIRAPAQSFAASQQVVCGHLTSRLPSRSHWPSDPSAERVVPAGLPRSNPPDTTCCPSVNQGDSTPSSICISGFLKGYFQNRLPYQAILEITAAAAGKNAFLWVQPFSRVVFKNGK